MDLTTDIDKSAQDYLKKARAYVSVEASYRIKTRSQMLKEVASRPDGGSARLDANDTKSFVYHRFEQGATQESSSKACLQPHTDGV